MLGKERIFKVQPVFQLTFNLLLACAFWLYEEQKVWFLYNKKRFASQPRHSDHAQKEPMLLCNVRKRLTNYQTKRLLKSALSESEASLDEFVNIFMLIFLPISAAFSFVGIHPELNEIHAQFRFEQMLIRSLRIFKHLKQCMFSYLSDSQRKSALILFSTSESRLFNAVWRLVLRQINLFLKGTKSCSPT